MANNNLTEAAQAATAALFSNASDDAQTAQERRSAARRVNHRVTRKTLRRALKRLRRGEKRARARRATT